MIIGLSTFQNRLRDLEGADAARGDDGSFESGLVRGPRLIAAASSTFRPNAPRPSEYTVGMHL